ncbi:MAG: UDP-N-acetylmuramate--L-alanine ligase [Clostridia bacterium]|nr:UDP-N-acetylmuramate--L-alanine ligase [Clostridia bacterium]
MKMQDIPRRVHFVGVGGIGMSALAQYLHNSGYKVTGSDKIKSDRTEALVKEGVSVFIGHSEQNVGDAELVVRTSAVHDDNAEVKRALKENVPVVLREQLLGAIFNGFKTRIAVCGTHGKTTVTAMIHQILETCGVSHTALIGGVYHGNNYYFGKDVIVAEACEFNRSFLNLNPSVCVCVNAEYDHPDCYRNEQDVLNAFERFINNTDKDGYVVLPQHLEFLKTDKTRVFYDCDALGDLRLEMGKPVFSVKTRNSKTYPLRLKVLGVHNACNALAAFAVADVLNLPVNKAIEALSEFDGVDRRWTESDGVCKIVRDYAHHPTEIECSLAAAKSVADGKVICLFQPHTYSRTQAFFDRFATCFRQADTVIYLPVYSARETPIDGINSFALAKRARELGVNAMYADSFDQAKNIALGIVRKNDLLLVVGAGDIVGIADSFITV